MMEDDDVRLLTDTEVMIVSGGDNLSANVALGAVGGGGFGLAIAGAVAALSGPVAVPVMLVGGLIAYGAGTLLGAAAGYEISGH